jgi:hypothetical protein
MHNAKPRLHGEEARGGRALLGGEEKPNPTSSSLPPPQIKRSSLFKDSIQELDIATPSMVCVRVCVRVCGLKGRFPTTKNKVGASLLLNSEEEPLRATLLQRPPWGIAW